MKNIAHLFVIVLALFIFTAAICDDDDDNDTDDDLTDDDAADDDEADDDFVDDDTSDDDDSDDDLDDDTDDDAADDDTADDDQPPIPNDENGIFVAKTGDDNNPGTMAAPKLTIDDAIDPADDFDKVVFVARGEYIEDVETSVSLYGGYNENDWSRDIVQNLTVIKADRNGAAVLIIPERPIVIDGFTIHAGETGYIDYYYSWGVLAEGGTLTLRNNIILGRPVVGYIVGTYGVEVENCQLKMINNVVHAGAAIGLAAGDSTGLWQHGYGDAVLIDNVIQGGPAYASFSESCGASIRENGQYLLVNNTFRSGLAMDTHGLYVNGTALLLHNTIVALAGQDTYGFKLGGGEAELINNIIQGAAGERAAVLVRESGEITLQHCDLAGPAGIDLLDNDGTPVNSLDEINACAWAGCASAAGNINADPLFAPLADYHLAGESPCIDAGIDPQAWYDGDEVYLDFDGDVRPQGGGWDIGMDEYVE